MKTSPDQPTAPTEKPTVAKKATVPPAPTPDVHTLNECGFTAAPALERIAQLERERDEARELFKNAEWAEKAERAVRRDIEARLAAMSESASSDAERLRQAFYFVQDKVADPKNDGTYHLHLNHDEFCELSAWLDPAMLREAAPLTPPAGTEETPNL